MLIDWFFYFYFYSYGLHAKFFFSTTVLLVRSDIFQRSYISISRACVLQVTSVGRASHWRQAACLALLLSIDRFRSRAVSHWGPYVLSPISLSLSISLHPSYGLATTKDAKAPARWTTTCPPGRSWCSRSYYFFWRTYFQPLCLLFDASVWLHGSCSECFGSACHLWLYNNILFYHGLWKQKVVGIYEFCSHLTVGMNIWWIEFNDFTIIYLQLLYSQAFIYFSWQWF